MMAEDFKLKNAVAVAAVIGATIFVVGLLGIWVVLLS